VALLSRQHRLSRREVRQLLQDVWQGRVFLGALVRQEQAQSAALARLIEGARTPVQEAAVANMDETGWRQRNWDGVMHATKGLVGFVLAGLSVRPGLARDKRALLIRSVLGVMAIIACLWLGYEYWRLLWQPGIMGAVDLKLRHEEVHRWFAGLPVYSEFRTATYPPASFVILWPLVGWLDITATRWLWAATSVLALLWLIYLLIQAVRTRSREARAFIALLPLSGYAAGATIGNGQLIVHLLPVLVAGLLLLERNRPSWRRQAAGAALLLVTLVKPAVFAPFFWIVLFRAGRWWLAIAVTLAYAALTLFAAQFQAIPLPILLKEWLARSEATAAGSVGANLHAWLQALGGRAWLSAVSILALALLGWWVYRHRRADLWLLLGVTACVSNLWAYHLWYDDFLLLLPMVALFRLARWQGRTERERVRAGVLLGALVITGLAPGGLYALPSPWNAVYVGVQTVVRLLVLAFLLTETQMEEARERGSGDSTGALAGPGQPHRGEPMLPDSIAGTASSRGRCQPPQSLAGG
jgi:hypothetical protein